MPDTVANSSNHVVSATPWRHLFVMGGATAFALILYLSTAAPGLTWAHYGADGGELLAAAVTNGVPHPPGYPLYMLLLQAWLGLGQLLWPTAGIAWLGNVFSVGCAALSVGVTVRVAAGLTAKLPYTWLWAGLVGLAWCVSPLPWSQALISEVYALHMLLVALLGWALFVKPHRPYWLMGVVALGLAHHLTFVLLLPAVLYYGWFVNATTPRARWRLLGWLVLGTLLGLLLHIRTPLAAAAGSTPAPINWGYPDNWAGFWWLISGAAYRGYLFNAPSSTLLTRVAAWANTLTTQLTPVGLAIMLVGLSRWDRQAPPLRNFSLLWLTPVSIYAINYYTRDSEIYLLPVIWLAMLWFGVGLATLNQWVTAGWPRWQAHWQQPPNQQRPTKGAAAGTTTATVKLSGLRFVTPGLAIIVCVGLMGLTGWRWSTISARTDTRAQDFLTSTIAVLEPHSIVISSADAETFALWYGAWGSGELLARHPDTVLINYALYQFPWYRRLVAALYPTVVGDSSSVEEILARNADRPIFFSEHFAFWPAEQMEAVGPVWRYVAP